MACVIWASSSAGAAECISRDLGRGLVFLRGSVWIGVSGELAYAAVTDYNGLAEYISSIDSSHVLSSDSTGTRVRQVGTVGLLLQPRLRMVLRFQERPPSLLRFEIEKGDLATFYGSWRFEPDGPGTRLVYNVTLKPPAFTPNWLALPVLENILCRTLDEIAAECDRRSESGMPSTSE
jgi:hypothetical protein